MEILYTVPKKRELFIQPKEDTKNSFSLNIHSYVYQKGMVMIWNGDDLVKEKSIRIKEGMNSIPLNCNCLPEGEYKLSLIFENEAINQVLTLA